MKKRALAPAAVLIILVCAVGLFAACSGSGTADGGKENGVKDDYGALSIGDVSVSIDQNKHSTFAQLTPEFTKPEKAETLRYVYDTSYLHITEDGAVTALRRENKTVNVRAECTHEQQHFRTVFSVEVKYVNYEGADANALYRMETVFGNPLPVAARAQTCEAVSQNTTLFLGDSFMDPGFIGEFMQTFAPGKDVLHAGMSSSSSYHWERAYAEIVGDVAPKNIAVHIGTNNFYDFRDSVPATEESLTRLLSMMHVSYPTTHLYWFTITLRQDTSRAQQVRETNEYMKKWCERYDFVTCVDTSAAITTDMLRDGVHPKTEHYAIFTNALAAAGCEIVAL